jgi:large subunit ribosomal protein L44e
MKIPKELTRYCPFCKAHTLHTSKEGKKGKTRSLALGHRKRQRRIDKGYHGFPYENPAHRSRGKKSPTSKKHEILLKCSNCGKTHKGKPLRIGKLEVA